MKRPASSVLKEERRAGVVNSYWDIMNNRGMIFFLGGQLVLGYFSFREKKLNFVFLFDVHDLWVSV